MSASALINPLTVNNFRKDKVITAQEIWTDVVALRSKAPLVHNITNYVVMNTTANALLAIGASPVMAHAVQEVEEIVKLAATVGGSLVINIGTLSSRWVKSMARAMKAAKEHHVPIVFDPVGAGASGYRTATSKRLLETFSPTVIRGNASEIAAITDHSARTKGVDSTLSSSDVFQTAQTLAAKTSCTVCVSGQVDLVTDGVRSAHIRNGHPLMRKVTGLGCTSTALIAAFLAVNSNAFAATSHAMAVMGICGELAAQQASGPGTLQLYLYDALYNLNQNQIETLLK
ncbi:MAG: hydroxyethylthiazole kinase [Calditrichaeota bacterium]|nr:MAG: hydroxyethylthiazole kinase [Calditrichota bacterium]